MGYGGGLTGPRKFAGDWPRPIGRQRDWIQETKLFEKNIILRGEIECKPCERF